MTFALYETDWTYLHQFDKDNAFREFTDQLNYVINFFRTRKNLLKFNANVQIGMSG